MNDMDLTVMRSRGGYFTWSNKSQGNARISSRIDWALINEEWINHFPQAEVVILNPSLSDHSALCVEFGDATTVKNRPFRFLNVLADHKDFHHIVEHN